MTATLDPATSPRAAVPAPGRHRHPLALRTPWYDLERAGTDRFAADAGAPSLQKYDTADLVPRLVADPRASLAFTAGDDDFATRRVRVRPRAGAGRLVTSRQLPTGVRRLYQPNHERFYAVTAELFCDRAGLPLPAADDAAEVTWLLRRRVVRFVAPANQVRDVARRVAVDVHRDLGARASAETVQGVDRDGDALLRDVLGDHALSQAHRLAIGALGVVEREQAWVVDASGGRWADVPGPRRWNGSRGAWDSIDEAGTDVPDDGALAEVLRAAPLTGEAESPMWRVPPTAAACSLARLRSVWFGIVQTFSGDHDVTGAPRLDSAALYRIRCVARRPVERGHEHCERPAWVSAPTAPFRLAEYADPVGTSRRKVSVSMPDLRDVADRALRGPGPGGVSITSPVRSRLSFGDAGKIPTTGSRDNAVAVTCSFSLELLMIVAMFVFSLFLPVVVLVFQLWFLLALRFCAPSTSTSLDVLTDFFASSRTLDALTLPEVAAFDAALGVPGVGAQLKAGKVFEGVTPEKAKQAARAAFLDGTATRGVPVPLPLPDDPLCGGGT